jgi:hypothetical protein
VVDETPPELTCPPSVSIVVLPGDELPVPATHPVIAAFLGGATASDNCGAVTLEHDAPDVFELGTHAVTFTATDEFGHVTTCTAYVTVTDCQGIVAEPDRSRVHFDKDGNSEFAFFRGSLSLLGGNLPSDFREVGSVAHGSLKVTFGTDTPTVAYCNDNIEFQVHDNDGADNREKWTYNGGPKEKIFYRWKDDQEYDALRDPNLPVVTTEGGTYNVGELKTVFIHDDETRFRFNFKDATLPITIVVDGIVLVTVNPDKDVSSALPFWRYGKKCDVLYPARLVPCNVIEWYADGDPSDGLSNLIYTHEASANGTGTDTYFSAGARFFIKVPVAGISLDSTDRCVTVELTVGQEDVTLVGCGDFTVCDYHVAGKNWKHNDGPDDGEFED